MLVAGDNPIWNDTEEDTSVWVCQVEGLEEQEKELRKRLQIAGSCTEEDHKQSEELLLQNNGVFVLGDQELGETDLVTHSINTGNAKPVQTLPSRLPYVFIRNWN